MRKKPQREMAKRGDVGSLLDEAEGRPAPKKKPKRSEDLDFDGVWTPR